MHPDLVNNPAAHNQFKYDLWSMILSIIEIEGNIGFEAIKTTKKCETKKYDEECFLILQANIFKTFGIEDACETRIQSTE